MFDIRTGHREVTKLNTEAEFSREQLLVLKRQVPVMYTIVCVNMIAVAITHFQTAPSYLTIVAPGILLLLSTLRTAQLILSQKDIVSQEQARKELRTTVIVSIVLGAAFSIWSISIFTYSSDLSKGQVAFFVGMTTTTVMTCLMPTRLVSIVMLLVVILPFASFLSLQPDIVLRSLAINIVLVSAGMVLVTFRSFKDFKTGFELNHRVTQLANEDTLTGLPNRRCFFNELGRRLTPEADQVSSFTIGVLDLDGFKPVNDVFGHTVGDELLREVAQRLQKVLPDYGMLARLGGDEFAILFPAGMHRNEVLDHAENLLLTLKMPFALTEGAARVSATMGLAEYPASGTGAETLFERADYALYYGKRNARGEAVFFSYDHETLIKEIGVISHRLREADLDEELSVAFQPIIRNKDGRISGFEALARWNNPILGNVSPDLFIRSAEQTGIIGKLTLILLSKSLSAAQNWSPQTNISFNLSAFDVCSKPTIDGILSCLSEHRFSPDRIIFEITESAVMQDFDRAVEGLQRLRGARTKIALDDFGTGFSSLSYIQKLPIDRVKIDRSFVAGIEHNLEAQHITKSILALCRDLNLECVVEGVESETQLRFLTEAGCELLQGYFFSKPLDFKAATTLEIAHSRFQPTKTSEEI